MSWTAYDGEHVATEVREFIVHLEALRFALDMASHRVVAARVLRTARSAPHSTVDRERRHVFRGHLTGTGTRPGHGRG